MKNPSVAIIALCTLTTVLTPTPSHSETLQSEEMDPHPRISRWMERQQKKNPEEYERLQDLREQDPEAFRKELADKLKKAKMEAKKSAKLEGLNKAQRQQLKEIENKILQDVQALREQDASSDEAIQKLRSLLEEAFDLREAFQQAQLEELRERIEILESVRQQRHEKRDQIVDRRLQELLQNPTPGDIVP